MDPGDQGQRVEFDADRAMPSYRPRVQSARATPHGELMLLATAALLLIAAALLFYRSARKPEPAPIPASYQQEYLASHPIILPSR